MGRDALHMRGEAADAEAEDRQEIGKARHHPDPRHRGERGERQPRFLGRDEAQGHDPGAGHQPGDVVLEVREGQHQIGRRDPRPERVVGTQQVERRRLDRRHVADLILDMARIAVGGIAEQSDHDDRLARPRAKPVGHARVDHRQHVRRPDPGPEREVDDRVDLLAQPVQFLAARRPAGRAFRDERPRAGAPLDQPLGLQVAIDLADGHRRDADLPGQFAHRRQRRARRQRDKGNLVLDGALQLLADRDGRLAVDLDFHALFRSAVLYE